VGDGLDSGDFPDMARRLGTLTGAAALLLGLARLGRLVAPAEGSDVSWQVVLLAAAVLGGVTAWVTIAYRLPVWAAALAQLVGVGLALLRVTVPGTLALGVLPTGETRAALTEELVFGLEVIRFGSAPVAPVGGLVGLLVVGFWLLGACISWGGERGPRWLATLPPVAFYLALAVLDRRAPGAGWVVAGIVVVGAALYATFGADTSDAGRVRDRDGRFLLRRSTTRPLALLAVTGVLAVSSTSAFAASVPDGGMLQWRSRSGFGTGVFGGTSLNVFVGLRQQVVSLGDEPVFVARLSDSARDAGPLYWPLVTLDVFDGENWMPGALSYTRPTPGTGWERAEWAFAGPTVRVSQRIRIEGLRGQLLPALYAPDGLQTDVGFISESLRGREDGAARIDVGLRSGWEYEVVSEVPVPDLERLASVGGELSPIFEEAARAGAFLGNPRDPRFSPRPQSIADRFLELPAGTAPEVRLLAAEVVADGLTRFEQALLLERWFQDPTRFTYSTDVDTGHSSLDLAAWLLDPESANHRTGYCEQFATAMAVMARGLGLPSRVVVGFTPGEVRSVTADDGSSFDLIVVRERNAHAWVEIWFDGQGWVRFDPTPRGDGTTVTAAQALLGFDPIEYLPEPEEPGEGTEPGSQPDRRDLGPEIDVEGTPIIPIDLAAEDLLSASWWWWAMLVLGVVAAIPAAKWWRRRRRVQRLRTGDVTAAWDEIVDQLRDLGVGLRLDLTPLEFAAAHDPAIVPLAELYTAAVYGPGAPADPAGATKAFERAETRLRGRYQRFDLVYARLRPTSLRPPR
jgi:transglutaminase-like putative cysteine protease